MRIRLLGTLAGLAVGAGAVLGQGRPGMAPQPMAPSGLYGVQPAQYAEPPMPMGGPAMGGPAMGGPGMSGPDMADPSGGLMPGGAPTYPPMGDLGGGYCGGGSVPLWWVNAEYLLWFVKSQEVRQPYVTTSAPGDFGLVGAPTTQILSSPTNQNYGLYSGFRIMGGWWYDADRRCGFEMGGMLSENKTNIFFAQSDPNGVPTLARTFNIAGVGPGVFIVSNIGQASGAVAVATTSRFYGVEANFLSNLYRSCPDTACFWTTDFIAGFRFFQLREDLVIDSSSVVLGGGATFVGQPVTAGGTISVHDSFETWNQFYGGQIGLRTSAAWGRCSLGLSAKIAFGLMHQTVDVYGSTSLTDAALGIAATASGGVFANNQNIGTYKNDEFAYIPEVGLTFGYQWCSWLGSYIGYNFLYVDRVVRPGDSLPTAVNPSLLPASNNYGIGAVVPVTNTTTSQNDFWIQGVTFGFNVRY